MLEFIAEVIARFGGRPAGSAAEREAQRFTRDTLSSFCDATTLEPFETRLTSHFGVLRPISAVYVAALALFPFSPRWAIALSLLNAVAFLTHFVAGRHWLDFLYPKGESWNVEGVVEPLQAASSTLVISGHIDSVYEFKWWYRLGHLGGALTVVAGFVVSLQWLALAFALVAGPGAWQTGLLILLVAESPILVVLFDMHDRSVPVDGASDNLTGVAMAIELGRHFSAHRLQRTRLRLVSFGAEEPYLRGSTAYAARHGDRLLAERSVLVNIDTIKDEEHLSIVRTELNTWTSYPGDLADRLAASFAATNVPVKHVTLSVGATDGVSFRRRGLPAISIIGMESARFDPAYHTRLDTLDRIDARGIESLREVLLHFVRTWDDTEAGAEGVRRASGATA